jgi:hypothetical protein
VRHSFVPTWKWARASLATLPADVLRRVYLQARKEAGWQDSNDELQLQYWEQRRSLSGLSKEAAYAFLALLDVAILHSRFVLSADGQWTLDTAPGLEAAAAVFHQQRRGR